MFQANVSERVIQKTTGHRPLQALQSYERVSADQHREVMPAQPSAVTTDLVQPAPGPKHTTGDLGKLFGGFLNCSIGSFTVNVSPTISTVQGETDVEAEFDISCAGC